MTPKTAFVLCAGLGTRLRPLTLAMPKPLIPLWNRPLLAHTLDLAASWGVERVFLNTHWLPEAIDTFVRDYSGPLKLTVLHEPEILGTGGCLRNLAPHLGDEPFWLINGDIVCTPSPAPLLEAFDRSGGFGAVWLEPKSGPRTVESDYAGRITCWHSPTPGVDHTATYTGVALLSPQIVSYLPEAKMCSLIDAFDAALYDGKFVQAVIQNGTYWNDVGTPEAYLKAHRDAVKLPALAAYASQASQPPEGALPALKALNWSPEKTIVIPLGARGSQRTFYRLVNGKRAVIAISYETAGRMENAKYAVCAKTLAKAGVAVPRVILDLPRLLILEDLGDETVDKRVTAICDSLVCTCGHPHAHPHHSPELGQIMELLAAFHRADPGACDLEPAFTETLYDWEVGLYEQFAAPLPPEAKTEWLTVRNKLLAEPQVLVHRDFQSTNLIRHKGAPAVIDFQGMRKGPALYDLASFLYDPYVTWSTAAIDDAITTYAAASGRAETELRERLPYAGVQRLIQALGAYHRLASVGQERFLAYVPAARTRAAALARAVNLPALAAALEA